jgi:S-DNA-T family DNA segregation ATPase FtsK/SpoIIIE
VLLLSGDPAEGPIAGGVKAMPLPPGRGQLVLRGERPRAVQLALSEPQLAGIDADRPTTDLGAS